jgi:hypothetical protein
MNLVSLFHHHTHFCSINDFVGFLVIGRYFSVLVFEVLDIWSGLSFLS